jgi:NAD(P)-dependent dehydrogenase (short-subunit alcohol dehydrogenase family)
MRTVLVTGASTGIGRATALRLDGSGWRVFAGVRKPEDGESLWEAASPRLSPVLLDVTEPDQIAAAAERVEREAENGLDGLVNNAGVAIPGPLETVPLEDFRRQLEVNLVAYVAVTQALLPQIRKARGRVVFISSIGGRIAFPFGGPYHASKFRKVIEDTAERGIPPEKVAKAIAHALESPRPKSRYLVGLDAKVQARLRPLLPTPLFDRIVVRQLNL